jgi:hypothetical protein
MIDRSLPLTDLHRHLDGNIRPQTILELGRQHNIRLPADELEALRPHVQIVENEPSLVAFLKKLDWGVAVLADYDACRRVAYENVEDLLRAGIDYAELRFSPAYMAMTHKLHPQGVVEAIIDGVAAGSRDFGIKTNLIGIMSRTFGTEQCKQSWMPVWLIAIAWSPSIWLATNWASRASSSPTTSAGCGMQACGSPCTPVKPPAPRACGRPFASWEPSASATASRPSRIRP